MDKYELAGLNKHEATAIEKILNDLENNLFLFDREYTKDHLIRAIVNGRSKSLVEVLNDGRSPNGK